MNTFIVSDFHFSHHNIIKYCNRPFKDIHHMNETLIANFNSLVHPEDETYHLGDFSMSEKVVPQVLRRLNGTHYLVHGNHDKSHPVNGKKSEEAKQRYLLYGFAGIYLQLENFHGMRLNHLPYEEPGEYGKRFLYYRPIDDGTFLLHGHQHLPPEKKLHKNMLDCGVDGNNYFPYHIDEIKAIVDKQRLIIKTNSQ